MTDVDTAASDRSAASERIQEILVKACEVADFDPSGATLIKFTNNAVYALEHNPVVVRIAGSTAVGDRVAKVVAVARWLAAHDMPAVRLAEHLPQPIDIHGHMVTFWHKIVSGHAPQPDGADLGRILRRYHSLTPPDFVLPQWDPISGIRQRIAGQDILPPADHRFLEHRCDEIAAELTTLQYVLPAGPIHGDAFPGNLIAGPSGPAICDFDNAAYGPREWDLTPVAVGRLRFNYPVDHHTRLVAEYGTDILHWPGFGVLRNLRELQLVTSVLPTLHANPSLHEQWRHRFTTFRAEDSTTRWDTYR
ncbi:phosphotransferase enzyme family protein [Nocardia wallacei]|uniref:phosphotransferase enzyme family protein n=1 Tax=Nocardia wallacei TaxID=480035 RepID=UPI002457FD2C|nr:phosphotransferase [Nocardia wallacei]